MQVDIRGRVDNVSLPSSKSLLPLFEAVVNSIQSIQSAESDLQGSIDVEVVRDLNGLPLELTANELPPITGFLVVDDGPGFDDASYKSFSTSDTTFKRHLGGKGVGRFLWLKAFDVVRIESVFRAGGKASERCFNFACEADGVVNHSINTCNGRPTQTRVRLDGFKEPYCRKCPRKLADIADGIIQHCLEYFVAEDCPQIRVRDITGDEICLNDRFSASVVLKASEEDLLIRNTAFKVKHLLLNGTHDHCVHYCAHKRVVKTDKVSARVPDLSGKIKDGEDHCVYAAYVSGDYLDSHVNTNRTDFVFQKTRDQETMDDVCWDELDKGVGDNADRYLRPYLDPVREQKAERIREYVETKAPQYRHILRSSRDALQRIAPGVNDEHLELELYKIDQKIRLHIREQAQEVLQTTEDESTDTSSVKQRIEDLLARVTEVEQGDLARYVVQRKAVLELLEKALSLKADDKYQRESVIHRIVYPMRRTSDQIDSYDGQNLWIIDERLSFHSYLSSDIPLKQIEAVDSQSELRPDIAIFNRRLAYSEGDEPYSSIVIIEFKRPVRQNYDEKDNPIAQVYDYIRGIRSGKQLDSNGRPISTSAGTSYYAYVIADLTPALQTQAENGTLTKTPDGMGYFGYNSNLNAYVEVISFSKLLADAKKRNRVLFDKLNLSP